MGAGFRTERFFIQRLIRKYCVFNVARERVHSKTVEEAVLKTARKLKGGYALVIMSPRKLIGVRDPLGLKPFVSWKTR